MQGIQRQILGMRSCLFGWLHGRLCRGQGARLRKRERGWDFSIKDYVEVYEENRRHHIILTAIEYNYYYFYDLSMIHHHDLDYFVTGGRKVS